MERWLVITIATAFICLLFIFVSPVFWRGTDKVVVEPPAPDFSNIDAIAPHVKIFIEKKMVVFGYYLFPTQLHRLQRWIEDNPLDDPEQMLYRNRPEGQSYDDIYLRLNFSVRAYKALDAVRGVPDGRIKKAQILRKFLRV